MRMAVVVVALGPVFGGTLQRQAVNSNPSPNTEENASWITLRRILQGQHRVTASFRRKDGRTLHVRKATRAEQPQLKIYTALDLDPAPGGVTKLIA